MPADEIVSARTEYARTYRRPGGGRRTLISVAPVNYRDRNGEWQPIDTQLVADGATRLQTAGSPIVVTAPRDLAGGLFKVTDEDDWVAFGLEGGSATGAVSGSTVTYVDAVGSTDAEMVATPTGLKETLTIQDRDAPATYRYRLSSSAGLTARLRADGSVAFTDTSGVTRFGIPAPTVQEAGGAVTTDHVAYQLASDGSSLTVSVDRAWLSTAKLPVEVDPALNTANVTSCTLTSGSAAGTSSCNGTLLQLGHSTASGQSSRIALRLASLGGIPQTATVFEAAVGMRLQSQTASGATPEVDARRLSRTLTTTASWNAYQTGGAWTTPGGDTTGPFDRSQVRTAWVGSTTEMAYFDISPIAEQWVRGDTNRGVLLQFRDETVNNVLTFTGSGGTSGNLPFVEIDWVRHPGRERDKTYERQNISDNTAISVDVSSGNLASTSSDLQIVGPAGFGLTFGRTYNATDDMSRRRVLADHWTLSINGASLSLERNYPNDGRVLRLGDGTVYRFDRDPNSDSPGHAAYRTPPGIDADMDTNTSTGKTTITFRRSGVKWVYNEFFPGDLESISDPHGNTYTTFLQTVAPNDVEPTQIRNGAGTVIATLSYDTNGALTRITEQATGRHWDYGQSSSSSGAWTLDTVTNPDLKVVRYFYTGGQLTKITDARGNDTTFGYGNGSDGDSSQVTRITRVVDGTTTNDVTTTFNYLPAAGNGDACTGLSNWVGRTVQTTPETSWGNNKTTYCWSADGQVTHAFDAKHRQVDRTYSATSNLATITGLPGTANNLLTTYNFSSDGRDNPTGTKIKATSASDQRTTINYCGDALQPACSTSPDPLFKYRPTLYTDEDNDSQAFKYGAAGSPLSTNPADLTEVISNTAGGTSHQSLGYDSHGNLTSVKDGNNNTTTYHYTNDFLDKITPPPPLAVETFTPDAAKRIASATDGNGDTTFPTYDGENRIKRIDIKNSAGTTLKWMTFTFDANGNITQRADSDGNTTTYVYDKLNRRTSETFPSSRTNTYVYDKNGNLKSLTDANGTTSYTYDEINRLASLTSPAAVSGNETISYAYSDSAGPSGAPIQRIATMPGGSLTHEVDTDLAGNVIVDVIRAGSTDRWKQTNSYLNGSNTSPRVRTSTDLSGKVTTYTYGPAERLLKAKTMNGSTPVEEWAYTYDAAGNRRTSTHTVGAGTPTTKTFAYNAANQLCWAYTSSSSNTCGSAPSGATTYAYDPAGNRTTGATWDPYPRLNTLGGTGIHNLAPGNGELVGYGTIDYQNNILGLGREIPSSGSATTIVREPHGTPVAQRTATSKQWLFSDRLGSTIAVTDSTHTTLDRTYTYEPYGTTTTNGTGPTTDILYAGGHTVGNLYHFGARYYDPTTATWTQRDPVDQIGSLTQANRYSYVGNNPINYVDPSGLISLDDVVDAAEVVAGSVGAAATCASVPLTTVIGAAACGAAVTGSLTLTYNKYKRDDD